MGRQSPGPHLFPESASEGQDWKRERSFETGCVWQLWSAAVRRKRRRGTAAMAATVGCGGPGLFDASVRREEDQQSGKGLEGQETGERPSSDSKPFLTLLFLL